MTTDWISIKDRLPEDDGENLLLCEPHEGKNGTFYFFCVGKFEVWDDGARCWNIGEHERYLTDYNEGFDRITHWAKIEPPEVTK